MSMSKTIVFFGTDDFSAVSLRALIDTGFLVRAVVTKPDSRKGRGRELAKPIVKEIAEAHNIEVWQPLTASEISENIKNLTSQTGNKPLGVLVSYGKIIPQHIIDLFDPGIINVHPSLLPKYRGPSPVETAILNGDTETGVTIMQLSAAMDAGPIYTQSVTPLSGTETAPELEQKLAEQGARDLCAILPAIMDGSATPTPQDDTQATYCQLLSKEASQLDTAALTAAAAERQVRAFLTFPKTKTTVAGHPIVVTKAHVKDTKETALDLECADGHFLAVDELIGPSGRVMSAQAFLNGYINR